jgi:hypothetical protein
LLRQSGVIGKRIANHGCARRNVPLSTNEVTRILAELEGKLVAKPVSDLNCIRGLTQGIRLQRNFWFGHFIVLITHGYLVPRALDTNAVGLHRILLSRREVESFLLANYKSPELVRLLIQHQRPRRPYLGLVNLDRADDVSRHEAA